MRLDLEQHVTADAGISFKRVDFDVLCGDVVYCFLKEQRPLYVGSTTQGLPRPASQNHHAKAARELADEVRVWPCKSKRSAKVLEEIMIRHLHPEFNRRAPAIERKRVSEQMGLRKVVNI